MPDSNAVSQKTGLLRPLILAFAGVAVLAAAGWLAMRPPALPPAAAVVVPVPPPAARPVVAAASGPSFDIVRVTPQGEAVVAGRAEPNAQVSLNQNGREIGRAQADGLGQWVILPDQKLAPGGQELSLSARGVGGDAMRGDAPVVVVVPQPAAAGQPDAAPPVLLTPVGEVPRLLQGQAPPGGKLALNVVDYDGHGDIRFAGIAPPGAALQVYVDNKPIGDARSDAQGRWSLQPEAPVGAGDHQLRVDQISGAGRVAARIQLPFQRSSFAGPDPVTGRVVVQPRQNLWRMARQAYGQGVRYTVIYAANREQIRDPNLIYPGQVIKVPEPAGQAGSAAQPSPPSSSRSR